MMKASAHWIDSYVGTGLDASTIAEKLTMAGTEVEKAEAIGDDTSFTLEVTSNRTDCLSVIGLARELAACTGKVVNHPEVEYATAGKAADVSSVEIAPDALAACPYYSAQVIRNVKVGPSPAWLRKRLEGIGLKPINNVVDITNFVLFETGQPLHAFDLSKLAGKRIVVRLSSKDEAFTPVAGTGEAIKLPAGVLVIADAGKPQAVGGIMGGAHSGVTGATTDILLESAYFEPSRIKATSRALKLESDSSYRFERDVDQGGVLHASRRAAALIAELTGGEVLDGVLEAGKLDVSTAEITVAGAEVRRVLGVDVPLSDVEALFNGLGCTAKAGGGAVTVTVPSFRRDLRRPIDLVEEIGRVHGLDKIPADLRMTVETAKVSRRQRVRKLTRQGLMGFGFSEALTDTFVNTRTAISAFSVFGEAARLDARNPVNAELPGLRRNLLGSLLIALANNQRHGRPHVRLYEVANVFLPGLDGSSSGEREVLGLIGGDFFDVKGAIESLLELLRAAARLEVRPLDAGVFAPGRSAMLYLGGRLLGVLGEPSAAACKEYDVDGACALAELDFDVLVHGWQPVPEMVELPRFPTAERDLAFVLDAAVTWAQVEACVREACDATLRDVRLFDEFTGKQVGAGKKSLAFSLSFRHDDKTLTSEEIEAQMKAAIAAVTAKLGGVLRG